MVDFTEDELTRLRGFENLLRLHNSRYNLVASSTMEEIWQRHILDSAQLTKFFPSKAVSILDIGSGAGFPGFVLSVLGYDVVLLDRNRHKCDFLRIACKAVEVKPEILRMDVRDYQKNQENQRVFDFVAVRAVANLADLLDLCLPFMQQGSVCLLLKGRNYQCEWDEVADDMKSQIDLQVFDSATSDDGVILQIKLKVSRET